MRTYVCVLIGSGIAALIATPFAIWLARRLNIVDLPGPRKIHTRPIPRLGGIAIALPVLAALGAVFALGNNLGHELRAVHAQLLTVLGGAAFMLVVGLADDKRGLPARFKLLAQLGAAAAVCISGVRIDFLVLQGIPPIDLGLLAWPLTLLWIVSITNAVNLIDGLDGLAAGIAAITCSVVAFFAIRTAQPVMAILMLACLGTLFGFLVFNFSPARIFLGDSGTYFIGFLLGAGSVMSATKTETVVGLALPLVAMGVPIFDVLLSILRRYLERRPIFSPDRGHIHHRLIALGLGQRQVVLILYVLTLLVAGLGLSMVLPGDFRVLLVLGCLLLLYAIAFRICGIVSLRTTVAALKRNQQIRRQERSERDRFHHVELLLREACTFDAWWKSLCTAADGFDFRVLTLSVPNRDGTTRLLEWRRANGHAPDLNGHTHVTVPIPDRRRGPPLYAAAEVASCDGSVESAGRQIALFSRLVSSYPLSRMDGNGSLRRETSETAASER